MSAIAAADPSRARRRLYSTLRFLAAPSSLFLLALALLAALAPVVAPYAPSGVSVEHVLQGPSASHLFGTDQFGRDVLSRTIWGARPTLEAALLSTVVAMGIGVPLGLLAGSAGRWTSGPIMRVMDVLLAFPGILLALVVVTIMGSGLSTIVVAVAASLVPIFARLVYGETTSLVHRPFIQVSRVIGVGPSRILVRHVLPNLTSQVLVAGTTMIGWAILIAASLNFLGFGVQPPTADWGVDLSNGIGYVNTSWWYATFPGLAIAATILAVNRLGDRLADRLDPRHVQKPVEALETMPYLAAGTDGAET